MDQGQSQRVYRLKQLATQKDTPGILPVSPATIWRWVREGHFPEPFKLGPYTTVWNAEEVDAFVAAQRNASRAKGVVA
jgi:predicted DNA-binding transcriptional regulator AlpA